MIRSKSNMRFQILANFILILFTIFVITPFILLIMSSFTEESTLIRNGYSFFPEKFSLEAYAYIWKNASKIMRALWNYNFGHSSWNSCQCYTVNYDCLSVIS